MRGIADSNAIILLEQMMTEVDPLYLDRISRELPEVCSYTDKVVGSIIDNDRLKRMWACKLLCMAAYVEGINKSTTEVDEEKAAALSKEATKKKYMGSIVSDLFWSEVRDEIDGWNYDSILIKSEWQIITLGNSANPLQALLRGHA